MKFFCLADEDTVRGFRLAGVEGRIVGSAEEAAQAIAELEARPEIGVLVLTQDLAAAIAEQVNVLRFEREGPLVVEIPGPDGPARGRKSLRQIVHSAVGIRVEKGG